MDWEAGLIDGILWLHLYLFVCIHAMRVYQLVFFLFIFIYSIWSMCRSRERDYLQQRTRQILIRFKTKTYDVSHHWCFLVTVTHIALTGHNSTTQCGVKSVFYWNGHTLCDIFLVLICRVNVMCVYNRKKAYALF